MHVPPYFYHLGYILYPYHTLQVYVSILILYPYEKNTCKVLWYVWILNRWPINTVLKYFSVSTMLNSSFSITVYLIWEYVSFLIYTSGIYVYIKFIFFVVPTICLEVDPKYLSMLDFPIWIIPVILILNKHFFIFLKVVLWLFWYLPFSMNSIQASF